MPDFIKHVGQAVTVLDAKSQPLVGQVTRLDINGDYAVTVPAGHWTVEGRHDEPDAWFFFEWEVQDYGLTILPLAPAITPLAPAITPLDDAGRAALKAGDRVLVALEVKAVDLEDSTLALVRKHSSSSGLWYDFAEVYALLPPAPKPIAAGDRVRILGGQVGKAIGQASDGTWAVEYDAGDSINISRYDASALEVVS